MLRTTRWVAAIIFLYSFPGYAEETFDTHFMIGGMRGEKVSEYRFDNKQPLPGNYELDFYVNHQWRGKKDITIPESPAKPCLPKVLLTTLGVKTDNLNTEDNCILLDEAVHGGQYQWDISEHRLNLTVPQAYINELERGYVPPESWDRGIDVFYTSYNLSQYRSYDSNNNSNTASYGRFNSGLNLFSWQLHSDASYSKPDDMKGKWQSNTLYLERGWSQILSTVQIGENYTSSLIFDSLRFSGIRLFRKMAIPFTKKRFPQDHLLSQICNFRAAALISMSALRKQMVVFVPFWFPTLPCPICCNLVFQISILSPDAVRYMVSRIRRTFSRQIIYMASTIF